MVSPTAHPLLLLTTILLALLMADCFKYVFTVEGATPWILSVPDTTICLFPAKIGSI